MTNEQRMAIEALRAVPGDAARLFADNYEKTILEAEAKDAVEAVRLAVQGWIDTNEHIRGLIDAAGIRNLGSVGKDAAGNLVVSLSLITVPTRQTSKGTGTSASFYDVEKLYPGAIEIRGTVGGVAFKRTFGGWAKVFTGLRDLGLLRRQNGSVIGTDATAAGGVRLQTALQSGFTAWDPDSGNQITVS